jgi:hypothetical protein
MSINLNNTIPSPPSGGTNVLWQSDASGNVSASVGASPATQPELALTGQTGNVSTTPLVASVPANARYRISFYEIVTTPGSVSSTLPSVVISWTDADNSTNQSVTFAPTSPTGNTDTTLVSGTILISAQAISAINVSTTGYASSAAGMAYSLYVETELVS